MQRLNFIGAGRRQLEGDVKAREHAKLLLHLCSAAITTSLREFATHPTIRVDPGSALQCESSRFAKQSVIAIK